MSGPLDGGVPRIPAPRPAADDLSPHAYRPPRDDSGPPDDKDAAAPGAAPADDGAGRPSTGDGTQTRHPADSGGRSGAHGQAADDGHVPPATPGRTTPEGRGGDGGAGPGAGGRAAGSGTDADGRSGADGGHRARNTPGAPGAHSAGPTPDAAGAGPDAHRAPAAQPKGRASHSVLKSLLGAWALSACSAEETAAVEEHLGECAPCADEALRLRDAVGLLHTDRDLDLDPLLRFRVLENCLGRRPARIPVPDWADPYDAETARLDALLRDIGESEWHAPVRLKWFEGGRPVDRRTTVAGVIGHLMSVDGLVSGALGLDDPLGRGAPVRPAERTEAFWRSRDLPPTRAVRVPWRDQSHALVRTVSFASRGVAEMSVSYGSFSLPLRDSLLDRAFECWIHADDIADAVDYPYAPPSAAHLNRMIDLAARLLPAALAERRRAGLAAPARDLVAAGAPGRSLHLEVEGSGGGNWYIALDSPAAVGSPDRSVAQVALDGVEFCRLIAGHVSPQEAAAGQDGDREAIRDVLSAAASLSRL